MIVPFILIWVTLYLCVCVCMLMGSSSLCGLWSSQVAACMVWNKDTKCSCVCARTWWVRVHLSRELPLCVLEWWGLGHMDMSGLAVYVCKHMCTCVCVFLKVSMESFVVELQTTNTHTHTDTLAYRTPLVWFPSPFSQVHSPLLSLALL